jgi:F-type H+-transporting ATPase subunit a
LIPGVDSIGILHHAEAGVKGHSARQVGSNVYILDVDPQNRSGIEAEEGEHGGEDEGEHGEELFVVTPFVRAAATDLNLTLGLALASVAAIQYYGIRALGLGYFSKFVNIPALDMQKKGPMGTIDFGVGILELISEFAKIISFAFRLLGNIFAGQVLLFVIAFLIPFALPVVFFGLEVFVGAIQAFVFAMLTLVFVNTAMISHHDEGDH